MKKLQNDYTTPEQSKRMLELGVPADSADGFYSRESYIGEKWERPKLFEKEEDKVDFKSVYKGGILMYFPLFTVGRLIEIYLICVCNALQLVELTDESMPLIEEMVCKFEQDTRYIDFSKLEE